MIRSAITAISFLVLISQEVRADLCSDSRRYASRDTCLALQAERITAAVFGTWFESAPEKDAMTGAVSHFSSLPPRTIANSRSPDASSWDASLLLHCNNNEPSIGIVFLDQPVASTASKILHRFDDLSPVSNFFRTATSYRALIRKDAKGALTFASALTSSHRRLLVRVVDPVFGQTDLEFNTVQAADAVKKMGCFNRTKSRR